MSYRRRHRAHVAQVHEFYESPSGQMQAWSSEEGYYYSADHAAYPGPRETVFRDAANHVVNLPTATPPIIRDMVTWDAGGIAGQTKSVGGMGITDPQTVDAHSFTGQMAVIRRMPEHHDGPVGTSDHNSLLSLLYAMQETASYYPNDVSQIDVIRAV